MKLPVYFDYAATTPVDKRVARKMSKYLTLDGVFGNASSRFHYYGWQAEEAVDVARNQVASLVGANSDEIIFTSGATESINLAIKGIVYRYCGKKGRHIITSATEHQAVLSTCSYLESQGFEITRVTPKKNGLISIKQIVDVIRNDTILLSIMHVNNEIGVIQDIVSFGNLCHSNGIFFHVDASQSVGKLCINLSDAPIDLMSFSAHKLYGPKGIGALYICSNSNIDLESQIHGGGHERGVRSGTLPVHQIVGMGEACNIAQQEMITEMPFLWKLYYRLLEGLKGIEGVSFNGDLENNVKTILNVTFDNINSEMFLMALKDIAVSSKSACVSSNFKSSHVLRALGLSQELALNSIRLSFGRYTTEEEIDFLVRQMSFLIKTICLLCHN
ncbi:aminotransferase class V-fold PLP-dependent enzyme [Blochmannia endosymbiont of Polyrhachis (Hedomyrma) turneri]|uniref:aminotransferase class V-fold PLP-dependent enzyme n=1 Tax=Blochmannia endosymbiont of Polyrhachis (Hedomyrma) turneri TaxID=1505596 RepID=UPI00061A541A|nr:aminotransferase class V-fold PLP-dependent enzyme [Blochmannia endosymbiont of Polyrhachis (Hedomyrma) turneri]AKC60095.1 cysteine desulfurase [Blochmannia endosymbiont of Polyrhachis (Hedomyrma) turneri]